MRHLRLYRAIRLIVQTGSIRKASEYLAISPSALNRSIQTFEAELGIEIFERIAGGVRLSVPGELVLRPMIEHLAQMDDFAALVTEMRGGSAGTLRVSVSGDLLPETMAPVLEIYRARHPKVTLEVTTDETSAGLVAHDVELALVSVPQTDDGVIVALSQAVPLVGRVAAGHARAGGALDMSDIAGHMLVVPPPGSGVRTAIDVALRRYGLTPAGMFVFPGRYPGLRADDPPDLQIGLDLNAAPDDGARAVDISALRLGAVQVTLLRRSEGTLTRAAEQFVTVLQGVLNAAA